jgi:Ca2+-binding RTX toxin-like protein
VLHADFSQVVLGLEGNDTLYADDTYYFFDGNTLYGGPSNDTLNGGYAQDILYSGPGNDTLSGGPSIDILNGGPGHDHIDGGGGQDVIGAQDGDRDWIKCGTTARGSDIREHDVVRADKIDSVARDCEVVYRR